MVVLAFSLLAYSWTLNKEAVYSSETLVNSYDYAC
jgi:hypothetical protein